MAKVQIYKISEDKGFLEYPECPFASGAAVLCNHPKRTSCICAAMHTSSPECPFDPKVDGVIREN